MVVVAKLKAVAGKEEQMQQALTDIIAKVGEEEGTLMYTLHQDQNDPSVFMFYEKYKDMDALVAHSSTPHFKALFTTIKPLLDGKPEIVMYNKLAGING